MNHNIDRLIGMFVGTATPADPKEAAMADLFERIVITNAGRLPTGSEIACGAVRRAAKLANLATAADDARLGAMRETFRAFCTPERVAKLTEAGRAYVTAQLAVTSLTEFWPANRFCHDSPITRLHTYVHAVADVDKETGGGLLRDLMKLEDKAHPPLVKTRDLLIPIVKEARLPLVDERALIDLLERGARMETLDTLDKWCQQQIQLARNLLVEVGIDPDDLRLGGEKVTFDAAVTAVRHDPDAVISTSVDAVIAKAVTNYADQWDRGEESCLAFTGGEVRLLTTGSVFEREAAFRAITNLFGLDARQPAVLVTRRRLAHEQDRPGHYWVYPVREDLTVFVGALEAQYGRPLLWCVRKDLEAAMVYVASRTMAVTNDLTKLRASRTELEPAANMSLNGFAPTEHEAKILEAHYALRAAVEAKLQQR